MVDDEENMLSSAKVLLELLGYAIITSKSSVEALEQFKQKPKDFNLVLTDLTVPNMTGLELAKHLKKVRVDISIVLYTGFSEPIKEEAQQR